MSAQPRGLRICSGTQDSGAISKNRLKCASLSFLLLLNHFCILTLLISFPHPFWFSKFVSPTTWHPWHFLCARYDVVANAMLPWLGLCFHSDWNLFHKTFRIKHKAEALSTHSNPTWTYFLISTPYSILIWCNNLLSFFHACYTDFMHEWKGWMIY